MNEEDIKGIAGLVDWPNYDKLMDRVLYDTFGKLLEEKFRTFEDYKKAMKDEIKQNYGDKKVPRTPKPSHPMKGLQSQLQNMKKLCFELEEEANNSQQENQDNGDDDAVEVKTKTTPVNSKASISKNLRKHSLRQKKVMPSGSATKPSQVKTAFAMKVKHQLPQTLTKAGTNANPKSIFSVPVQKMASQKFTHPPTTLRQSARIKEMHTKTTQAEKQREELLSEKSERVKRDHEERAQRVGQNNRAIEAENRERDEKLRFRTNSNSRKMQLTQNTRQTAKKSHAVSFKSVISKQAKQVFTSPSSADSEEPRPKFPIRETRMPHQVDDAKHDTELEDDGDNHEEVVFDTPKTKQFNGTVIDATIYDATFTPSPRAKQFIPSTEDNYCLDDLSSNDSTDNEDKPRKQIPAWAKTGTLVKHIKNVNKCVTMEQKERYFGHMKHPKLEEIFGEYRDNRKNNDRPLKSRNSSATWESPLTNPRPAESRYQQMKTKVELQKKLKK